MRTTRPRATMSALDLDQEIFQSVEEVDEEILRMTADEISRRTRLLENIYACSRTSPHVCLSTSQAQRKKSKTTKKK